MTAALATCPRETHRQELAALLDAHPLPELAGKRIFLTGATGFVGYWLLIAFEVLNRSGANIHIQALSRDPEVFLRRHSAFKEVAWLHWTQGDVRRYTPPEGSFDAVIHGATDTSPAAAQAPDELHDTIVNGSRRVLDHAIANGTQRILLLSSGAVYGEPPQSVERLREDMVATLNPSDPGQAYGAGKQTMEALGFASGRDHGLTVISARGFSFLGHGLPPHLAIAQFIRNAQEKPFIAVNGNGQPMRSFLYAADMAVWFLTLLARGRAGAAYNVGSPHGLTLAEAARVVRDVLSPTKPVVIADSAASMARQNYLPDVRLAEQELGLRAWTTLHNAIQQSAQG